MNQKAEIKNILIAVPSTGGVIKSKTAQALFNLSRELTSRGFNPTMFNINGSDVVTVRNTYANIVLNSEKFDALLFIDSDMEFAPRLILRMIALNVPVAGVACTTKEFNFDTYHQQMNEHGDAVLARARASRFNVLTTFNSQKPRKMEHRNGFSTMAAVGMAVYLIRKTALQAMVEADAVDRRADVADGVSRETWGFFDQKKVGGVMLLEDYSFCYRWVEVMKRKLWVCTDALVKHIGDFDYGAVYAAILQAEAK